MQNGSFGCDARCDKKERWRLAQNEAQLGVKP